MQYPYLLRQGQQMVKRFNVQKTPPSIVLEQEISLLGEVSQIALRFSAEVVEG
jgi:hypothetical protein